MFTPLTGTTNPTLGVKPTGGIANGLGRKNTVRARGSIDMFMPDNGIDAKPSYNDLRSKASRGNLQQTRPTPPMSPPSEHPAIRPSTSDRERERRPTNPQSSQAQPFKASDPFGKELAQVSELAEEYGVGRQVKKLDEEEREMQRKNLKRFTAEEYIAEFQYLLNGFFGEVAAPAALIGGGQNGMAARKQVWI